MTDIQKLKALAEAATQGKWSTSGSYIAPTRQESGTIYVESWRSIAMVPDDNDRAFIAAANPAAVLELIAEIEALKRVSIDATSEAHDAKHDLCELHKDFAQLKADNEALRKDAERYRWVRDNASLILDRKTAYPAETGFIKFDKMPARSETEAAIDAAISNRVEK